MCPKAPPKGKTTRHLLAKNDMMRQKRQRLDGWGAVRLGNSYGFCAISFVFAKNGTAFDRGFAVACAWAFASRCYARAGQ